MQYALLKIQETGRGLALELIYFCYGYATSSLNTMLNMMYGCVWQPVEKPSAGTTPQCPLAILPGRLACAIFKESGKGGIVLEMKPLRNRCHRQFRGA